MGRRITEVARPAHRSGGPGSVNHDPFGGIQALLSPNGLQWRVVPFQDRDRGAWRDLARADRHESASHVQGKGGMVGRSRGYHSPPRGFGAVESVEQYGGDAPPERAGVHHEAADIQGAVLEPNPGHRSGQADLVVEAEDRRNRSAGPRPHKRRAADPAGTAEYPGRTRRVAWARPSMAARRSGTGRICHAATVPRGARPAALRSYIRINVQNVPADKD